MGLLLRYIEGWYLGHVCGGDDPGAVCIVVVLDRVVWRGDDTAGTFQLTATHGCYKILAINGLGEALENHCSVIQFVMNNVTCFAIRIILIEKQNPTITLLILLKEHYE